jgi:cytosine permease
LEKYALDRIPDSERRSWWSIALIWAGSIISVSALMVGGVIVQGMPLVQGIIAGAIGYTIVLVLMIFQGMMGADFGVPTVITASSAFGSQGAKYVISAILAISCIGWFGVQTGICGAAFSQIMYMWLGVEIPVWLSGLIWGIIMLLTAVYGYEALEYLNYIAIPALIILCIVGVVMVIKNFGAVSLKSYTPKENYSWSYAIGLSVGGFAVGGTIAADLTRYARKRKDAILSGLIGIWPAGVFLVVIGGLLTVVAGTFDITIALAQLGLGLIGSIILVLATWTTNTVNAYSGGLALVNLFNLKSEKRGLMTLIAGAIGTILAVVGLLDHFTSFLTILTAGIPPVSGCMIADYWICKKGNKEAWQNNIPKVNWVGLISWAVGFAIAIFVNVGISAINGVIASMVLYCALYYPFYSKKTVKSIESIVEK